ncbi:MAG TPA: anti-sigma factor [Actinomycetota bacterium]|nr:anti-sigma factor [Actinomycetota bacterium]
MTHDDLKDLVPLYALDALPSEDEAQLVAHLESCRDCSDLLAEHRETAGMLAFSAPTLQGSRDLRERILREASKTSRLQVAPQPARSKPIVRPVRRWQWVGGLAAACVVLLVGGLVVRQLAGPDPGASQQEILLAQREEALSIISSPSSSVIPMSSTDEAPDAYGKVFVSGDDERAAVLLSGLSDPEDDVYTLWVIQGGTPERISDFDVRGGAQTILVDRPLDESASLAVTREPNPGNTSPEGPIVIAT